MSAKKAATAALMSACVASGVVTVAAPAAQAAPTKACVNKKSGELRILLKSSKKCKKGWEKASWNQTGATGAPGAAGGPGATGVVNIKDATGAVIGYSLFESWSGLNAGALVYTADGAYTFNMTTGRLMSSEDEVYYLDAGCSTAVTWVGSTQRYLGSLTSFGRIVARPGSQPPRAFKGTSTVRAVTSTDKFWYVSTDGICAELGWQPMETLAVLEAVTPPADRPGPLSIS